MITKYRFKLLIVEQILPGVAPQKMLREQFGEFDCILAFGYKGFNFLGKKVSNYVNSIINRYAALKDKESAFMFRDVIEVNMQILIIEFFLSVLLPEIL